MVARLGVGYKNQIKVWYPSVLSPLQIRSRRTRTQKPRRYSVRLEIPYGERANSDFLTLCQPCVVYASNVSCARGGMLWRVLLPLVAFRFPLAATIKIAGCGTAERVLSRLTVRPHFRAGGNATENRDPLQYGTV